MQQQVTAPSTGLVRVGLALALGTLACGVLLAAGSSVLIPDRIAASDPATKVTKLALLHVAGASSGVLGVLAFGALSDRTRSRAPYVVGGAVAAALLAVPLARATTFGPTVAWWCLVVVALTAPGAAVPAVLADRVPVPRRATLSGVIGVSALLAAALGSVLGSVLRSGSGFLVAGALTAVLGVAAVLVAPDPPRFVTTPAPRRRWRLPRGAPDFWWAFWARFLLVVGYFMVNGFQLYLFTDRVGLSRAAAGAAVATTSVVFLVAAVVGSAVVGPLSDRLGRRKVFVVGASLLAVAAGAVPFVLVTVVGMLGFAVLGGLAFGTYYAVDQALLSEVLPDASSRAADLAVFAAATSAGQVLAPAISAGLVAVGGFTPLFVVAMAMCAGAAACVRPIRSVP